MTYLTQLVQANSGNKWFISEVLKAVPEINRKCKTIATCYNLHHFSQDMDIGRNMCYLES